MHYADLVLFIVGSF